MEATVKTIGSNHGGGVIVRYQDENNFALAIIRSSSNVLHFNRRIGGIWERGIDISVTIDPDTVYLIKIVVIGVQYKVYLNGVLKITETRYDLAYGKIGLHTSNAHVHFDDVKASGISVVPSAYSVNVRAGVTQIITTCTWSGSGNITISNLTSPTTTYYESSMSIYERTTVHFDGINTVTSSIRRATLSIPPTSSPETWTLYLNLTSITTYQVSVETS